jgi:hypothetical protein
MESEDLYAQEREWLIEGDPIAVVDELLELRRVVAGLEYEYSVQWSEIETGVASEVILWWTLEEAREILDRYDRSVEEVLKQPNGYKHFTGEIVKRRKAGKPGKVEKA